MANEVERYTVEARILAETLAAMETTQADFSSEIESWDVSRDGPVYGEAVGFESFVFRDKGRQGAQSAGLCLKIRGRDGETRSVSLISAGFTLVVNQLFASYRRDKPDCGACLKPGVIGADFLFVADAVPTKSEKGEFFRVHCRGVTDAVQRERLHRIALHCGAFGAGEGQSFQDALPF